MSLIRERRRRKTDWIDARKGMSPARLIVLFVGVALAIWYLGWAF